MASINYKGKEGDDYHKSRHKEIFHNQRLLEDWGDYAAHTYFSNIRDNSKILEIGAGTGINMFSIKNRTQVTIVEPSDFARSHCESLGLAVFKDISEIEDNQTYDVIFMRHVLEHLISPDETLRSVKKKLAPNGVFKVIVPVESGYKKHSKQDPDHHLYCWNRQTLSNLMESCGYQVTGSSVNFFNGRRLFSGIKKLGGIPAYALAMKILGTIVRKSEIIIEATH